MIQFQQEIIISAKPETIFAIYENVDGWCQWDAEVQSSSIAGDFVPGAKGTLKPTKGPAVKLWLTRVEKNRSFTSETALPLCKMQFEHQLTPEGKTTQVLHRVSFSGPFAFFFGRVIGNQIGRGLPEALEKLKAAAETRPRT